MKIIIDIPEKTNAHIRSNYGHGVKGLYDEDREILCDAIYNGTPYEERPHGKRNKVYLYVVRCPKCKIKSAVGNFCMWCGAEMRGDINEID